MQNYLNIVKEMYKFYFEKIEEVSMEPRHKSNYYDWKNKKRGWPYKGDAPDDPQYIKDRDELFKESGNGWWWYQGTPNWKDWYNKYKKERKLVDK